MNRILNNKINHDLTGIIRLYLLPSIEELNILKPKILDSLFDYTLNICSILRTNSCYDDTFKKTYYNLKNTKIVRDHKYQYWTIRKILKPFLVNSAKLI